MAPDVNNLAKPALIGTYKAGSPVYAVELRANIVYLATEESFPSPS